MKKILLVYTLCASKKEAEKIARECVNERLAACANVLAPSNSFFRWNGKLVKRTEYPIVLKTTGRRYSALEKKIRSLHSYELPCVVAFELKRGSKDYLKWVADECASRNQ